MHVVDFRVLLGLITDLIFLIVAIRDLLALLLLHTLYLKLLHPILRLDGIQVSVDNMLFIAIVSIIFTILNARHFKLRVGAFDFKIAFIILFGFRI